MASDSLSSQACQGKVFSPIALSLTLLGFPNIFISECPTAPAQGYYARDTPYVLPEMLFDFLLIKHPIGSLSIPIT